MENDKKVSKEIGEVEGSLRNRLAVMGFPLAATIAVMALLAFRGPDASADDAQSQDQPKVEDVVEDALEKEAVAQSD